MKNTSYFVGDVHGRSDLLKLLLNEIDRSSADAGSAPRVVFLGDLVDRDFDSRGCLELVKLTLKKWPSSVFLKGNHDLAFLEAVTGVSSAAKARHWFDNWGGVATSASYCASGEMAESFDTIMSEFPGHLDLIRHAPTITIDGSFIACHAGINPRLAIDDQHPHDLMNIVDGFLDHVDPGMPPVVHGHSIMGRLPVMTENRISLDTGAYETGRLTCLTLDHRDKQASFMQTCDGAVNLVAPLIHDRGYAPVLYTLGYSVRAEGTLSVC